MIIHAPEIQHVDAEQCKISFELGDSPFTEPSLTYYVPVQQQQLLSESVDCALIALLMPCMAANEPIILNGHLSRRLFTCLPNIQVLLRSVYPELNIIPITAERLIGASKEIKNNTIATGFSGGVDSFATVADIKAENIEYFLFNNVGSHGGAGERLFEQRYKLVSKCAAQLITPLLKVNSNLDLFYDNELLNFVYNHTLRNISVALLFQQGINQFYYASAYHLSDFQFYNRPTIAHLDPILLPLLSTENIVVLPHGTLLTRFDKTKLITNFPDSYQYLDVCVDEESEKNCSHCYKCRRTMATLDILGKRELYKEVFDFSLYDKKKLNVFYELYSDKAPMAVEIVDLAKESNYSIPFGAKLLSKVFSRLKLPYRFRQRLIGKT
ncbi:MAG: hypothetical protein CML20_20580 [Rheinheimera sp.]|nr:hypothetical protein [Rheinheimera sp.]